MTSTDALLVVEDLIAGYLPGVDILHGCSVTLGAREIVGIIGPNGAGKSTLLKAAFGLVPVRSGTVTLAGESITNRPAHELVDVGVGYVPQRDNVFPSLTIEENLRMGAYPTRRRGSATASTRSQTSSRCSRPAASSAPAISRVANGRWSRWAGP